MSKTMTLQNVIVKATLVVVRAALIVSLVTWPALALVEECNLLCETSSRQSSLKVEAKTKGCIWSNVLDLADDDLDLQVDPEYMSMSLFSTSCEVSRELRWMPGLRAVWALQPDVIHYDVMISELSTRKLHFNESRCFSFDIEDQDLVTCSYTCQRITSSSLLIRVLANSSDGHIQSESTINFHNFLKPSTPYAGLSAFYRRPFVPEVNRTANSAGQLPNPRYWTSIVTIRNDSCRGQVNVTFDLARPEVEVDRYELMLIDVSREVKNSKSIPQFQNNQTVATHVFTNVTPGTYYIRVDSYSIGGSSGCMTKIQNELKFLNYNPCPEGDPSLYCMDVDTGYFIIKDKPRCSYSMMQGSQIADTDFTQDSQSVPLTIGLTGLGVVIIVVVVVLILIRKIRVKIAKKQLTSEGEGFIEPDGSEPEGGVLEKKKVLLVYSRDNNYHMRVVSKLARLLREVGNCKVILDMEDGKIGCSTPVKWVTDKFKEADKVIFIKSEGALRRMNLDNGESYIKIETNYLGAIFTASVHILGICALEEGKGRYLTVGFDYSNLNKLSEMKSQCIFGNNNQFQLLAELNNLLLAIRDLPQCSPSGLFRLFSIDQTTNDSVSCSNAYKELQKAVSEAFFYHRGTPNWFHSKYGEPVPRWQSEDSELGQEDREVLTDLEYCMTPTPSMICLEPPRDEEDQPVEHCPLVPPMEGLVHSVTDPPEEWVRGATHTDSEEQEDSGFMSSVSSALRAMVSVDRDGSHTSQHSLDMDRLSDQYSFCAPESDTSSVIDIITLQEQFYTGLIDENRLKV